MRILVADDDPVSRRIAESTLHTFGHECDVADDGQVAWDMFQKGPYDVVITDRQMPGLTGIELTELIRAHPAGRRAYVLLLTGVGSAGDALEGVSAGADDYLTKPLDPLSLQMRLVAAARLTALHQQLELMTSELERAALTDPLTGLGNRLALRDELDRCASLLTRYGHVFCLALIDIDLFKPYNDTYGHLAGDRALVDVAGALQQSGRAADRAYRYGGEEFVLILPEQDDGGARTALERVRRRVLQLALPHSGSAHHMITVSIGAALLQPEDPQRRPEQVLAQADVALYAAKERGRNTLVCAWDDDR